MARPRLKITAGPKVRGLHTFFVAGGGYSAGSTPRVEIESAFDTWSVEAVSVNADGSLTVRARATRKPGFGLLGRLFVALRAALFFLFKQIRLALISPGCLHIIVTDPPTVPVGTPDDPPSGPPAQGSVGCEDEDEDEEP